MTEANLPIWWPNHPPVYDIHKSYLENLEQGPFFEGTVPERSFPKEEEWTDFLGFKVASRIGIPAGPLLNSRWVSFAAQMGFDILTYKTIRSKPYPAHPLPNMIYVETAGNLNYERMSEVLYQAKVPPIDMRSLAATNSFGMPSRSRDYLVADIEAANASLVPGQVMLVSVVATPRDGEDFIADFAEAARIALDGGAKIIEANLSCPNVTSSEGSLFTNPKLVFEVALSLKQAIGSVPLVLKMGVVPNPTLLKQVMVAAANGGAEAICGINTMSMKVVDDKGDAALGESRLRAGICGGPIHDVALDFISRAHQINQQEKLGLTLIGTGGATLPEHFDQFFAAGADAALSAVGMMWDPYLGARYHQKERKHG